MNELPITAAERLIQYYKNTNNGMFPLDGLFLDIETFFFVRSGEFIFDEANYKGDAAQVSHYVEVAKLATEQLGEYVPPKALKPSTEIVLRPKPTTAAAMADEILERIRDVIKVTPTALEAGILYHGQEFIVSFKSPVRVRVVGKPADEMFSHAALMASKKLRGETKASETPAAKGKTDKEKILGLEPKERVIQEARSAYTKGMYSKEHFAIFGVYVIFNSIEFSVPDSYAHHPFLKQTCEELNTLWTPHYAALSQEKKDFTQYELFTELAL